MMKVWWDTVRKRWKNVTVTFSDEQRHYKNIYLEICEVYDEVALPSDILFDFHP